MKTYTAQETIAEVNKMPRWLHSIDVGNGVTTPGHNNTWDDVDRLGLAADMSGKRVLDIGAADGFFSFLCEQRGAEVTAIDIIEGLPVVDGEHGFKIAARLRRSRVSFRQLSVYDLGELDQTFDIVFFLNVLYHLKHPLYGLHRIRDRMNGDGELYVKSYFQQDFRFGGFGFDVSSRALCRFYESDGLGGDYTNWWAPNRKCIEAMLRATGFVMTEKLAQTSDRVYYRARV